MKSHILTSLLMVAPFAGTAEEDAFLAPPQHVGPPQSQHAVTNRAFQGIPSMAVTPGGRLWANWYAGVTPGEDQNNYVVLSTSGDGGKTWREVLVIDPDGEGPVRTFDPELWMAPDGKLRVFWAQTVGHESTIGGVWCIETAEPESPNPSWGKPARITNGVMMCKPIVLSSGEWVLPASTWRQTDDSAKMVISTDHGKTWSTRGACNVQPDARQFDEHMFVERKDGSLWLLVRTKYGIGESVSADRGATWPELTPSAIAHPSARFFITRLNSGNLLLVKHGPISEKIGRSHLTAFVSHDDGKTWGGGLLLDQRNGVSYPDGQQTADGLIRIIYDYSRTGDRHILMATFREEDAAAGKAVTDAVRLRQLVSEASGGQEKPRSSTPPEPPTGGDLLNGFAHPPVTFDPGPEYGPDKRNYQGIPTIERAPRGRLWAAWYAGKIWEDKYNYVLAATSGDDGKTWSDPKLVIDPDGDDDRRASDPCLWLDPGGRLWLFWWMNGGGLHVTLAITTENPNDENPVWTAPRALFPGVMLNKPAVLKNGDWLMPAAIWKRDNSARVMISKDRGKSFTLLGAANIPPERRNCDEHMIVERKDGSLMMLVRTAEHGIGRSISRDGGRTWTGVEDYLPNATSRFFLRRLASDNLLLIKHGPIDRRIDRSELTAHLSEDDGETWKGGLMIDERKSVSYPDGTQAPDGGIYVIYDWERGRDKNILMASFTEADVRAGSFSLEGRRRVLINHATGINPRIAAAEKRAPDLDGNADAAPFVPGPRAKISPGAAEIRDFETGALLFRDREYRLARTPPELAGRQFVFSEIGGASAECIEGGMVCVLTPAPKRNRDSAEAELLRQGFAKAAIPECILFGGGAANACCVYQRTLKPGDKIAFGKWGVLVF